MGSKKGNPVRRTAKRNLRAEIRPAVFPAAYEYVEKNFSPWHCEQIYRKDGKVLRRMDIYKIAFHFFKAGMRYSTNIKKESHGDI